MVSNRMLLLLVEVVLEGWGTVRPQEICFTFMLPYLSDG